VAALNAQVIQRGFLRIHKLTDIGKRFLPSGSIAIDRSGNRTQSLSGVLA